MCFVFGSFAVVVGTGKRLFGEGAIPVSFRLMETQQIGHWRSPACVASASGPLKYRRGRGWPKRLLFLIVNLPEAPNNSFKPTLLHGAA